MQPVHIRGVRLVTPEGERITDVLIDGGKISRLGEGEVPKGAEEIDGSGRLLLPGLIDCHVHFREPGLEHKSTMASEAASARAGGVTTVCEMPNTIPPTVTVAALADKVRRAAEVKGCDLRFFFNVMQDAHLSALRTLCAGGNFEVDRLRGRCCGVKLYLDHSTGNMKIEGSLIEETFQVCGEYGLVVVCHCEDSVMNQAAAAANTDTDISAHSRMRPPESEKKSIEFAIGLAKKTGAHLHVAHLTTSYGIDLVRQAKKDGLHVTCEVAPHHLFLTVDDYASLGTLVKMNPPLRTRDHRDALWRGIMDGTVDCVATDHAPHTLEEKQGAEIRESPLRAPSGVPGVETMLPLLLSVCAGKWPHPSSPAPEGLTLSYQDVVRLCFTNPNRIFTLGKTGVTQGADADCTLLDPKKTWIVSAKNLHSACTWTPFEAWTVAGAVVRVF